MIAKLEKVVLKE